MKRIQILLLAMAIVAPTGAIAQIAPVPELPEAVAPAVDPAAEERARMAASGREVVRIAQDYRLAAGDGISSAVVIFGRATIEGHVYGDLVVILGPVQLASTAVVDGDFVVIGGSATAAGGARVGRDVVVVGGAFDAPAEFSAGGQHVVIGSAMLGGGIDAIIPWVTRGWLWGRLIVPDLRWVWVGVAIVFFVSLVLNLLFNRPVRACAATLVEKPLTTVAVGLLVLLLAGPVCLLLAVSVVGIAVLPFVFCALLIAWIIGKVAVARAIGMTAVAESSDERHAHAFRSFAIGFAVICVAYTIPVLGVLAWAMSGVFGLGAATLAVIAGYRAENPGLAPQPGRVGPDEERGVVAAPVPAAALVDASAIAVPPALISDLLSFPRARFRDRLAAFVLDVLLVGITRELLELTSGDSSFLLLLLAYHVGFWTWKGTTVGGIICQLRLVRVDGTVLRFVDALVRGLSSIFSLAVLGLGCLWMLKDPERQAWHDKIAGTYVVKVPRNWPI